MSNGFGGNGMFTGEFGFGFHLPDLDFSMHHEFTVEQQSQEWFNYGLVKGTKMWGVMKEKGDGFFAKFSTFDNGHLATRGVGVHSGDFSGPLNVDLDNFGIVLDVGIGPWDLMPEVSLKNGFSFGHTYTDEATGEMNGVMVSMPFFPTPGPLGQPSYAPEIIP